MAGLERFSDVTQYFHTWDGGHTVPLQKGEAQQSSSRKVLTFNPSEINTHTTTTTTPPPPLHRIQAFLSAQASCCFLYEVPLSEDEWLLSLCSCLSSSEGLISPGSFDP